MKVRVTARYSNYFGKEFDLAGYIASELTSSDYGEGQLETTSRAVREIAEKFGRLVDSLAERRIITEDDILKLIPGSDIELRYETEQED